MQEFVSFQGFRPLDPHQGFALNPLEASGSPQTTCLLLAPPFLVQKFLDLPQIAGEGLQKLGLCSVPMAFEQGWISIVPHLL
jgi:hypothetical protein